MIIKRNSWHYKISNLLPSFEVYNDNLCLYFWRVIGTCALLLCCVLFLCFLFYIYFTNPIWIACTIAILFVMLSVILPGWAIYFVRKKCGRPPVMPGENIIFEYIKAKKRKICPLIKYID